MNKSIVTQNNGGSTKSENLTIAAKVKLTCTGNIGVITCQFQDLLGNQYVVVDFGSGGKKTLQTVKVAGDEQ